MFTSGMALKTAVTDLLNAFIVMMLIFSLLRHKPLTRHHQLWINAFIAFTFVSVAGFVLHGFNISEALLKPLWCIMFWCLNYMLASYVIAVKYDLDGDKGIGRFRKMIVTATVLVSLFLNATVFYLRGMDLLWYSPATMYCV